MMKKKPARCSVPGCPEDATVAGKCRPHYDRASRKSTAAEVVGSLRDGSMTEQILIRTTSAVLAAVKAGEKSSGLSRSRFVHNTLSKALKVSQ